MKINIQKLKVSIIYITIFLCYNLVLHFIPSIRFETWVRTMAFLAIFLFLTDTIFFILLQNNIFSVSYIFVSLSFLFHMGQVILHAFFRNYNYIVTDFLKMYSKEITKSALLFSLNIIQIVTLFILLSTDSRKKRAKRKAKFHEINNEQLKLMGWIMCIITVPMKFFYILKAISIVQDDTYVSSTVPGFSGVYIQISNFCIIAFVVLLFAYSYNKVKQKIILYIGVIFYLWSMLSGGRMYGVTCIIILLLCHIRINNTKIKFKNFVLIAFFGILLLQLITAITYIRTTHSFNIINLVKYAFNPSNNFLLKVLDEFGGTVGTVIFTFDEVPNHLAFHKGYSYIKSWLFVGLNINGILDQISKEVAYTMLLSKKFNLGGSYIGELYYNFGDYSYFFAPFIGVAIGKISEVSEFCFNNKYAITFAVCVMPIYGLISWVRGYFDSFTRAFVWGIAFVMIIYFVCKKIYIKSVYLRRVSNE